MNIIVGCVVIDNNKVLMVQESKNGKIGFPVGHLEDNESIIEGALRETFEESGYNVNLKGILPISELSNDKGKYVLIRFVADVKSKEDIILDGISDVMWISFNDLLSFEDDKFRYKENKEVIRKILNNEIYPLGLIESFSRSEVVNYG